jgi:hypothetical protein
MQTSLEFHNVFAAFTHPAVVLLLKVGVTLRVYRPPFLLGSSTQPQNSGIFRLESGRLAIAVYSIDIMVISTIDVNMAIVE